jgi:hypothetical protein
MAARRELDDNLEHPRGGIGRLDDLVPVQRQYGNVSVLKDGSFRLVIRTTAINLDLMSPDDRANAIHGFGELLNSLELDFPLMALLHASPLDTSRYTGRLRAAQQNPATSPQMRELIEQHIEHYVRQAREHYLLDRSRYFAIPWYQRARGGQPLITGGLAGGGAAAEMPLGGFVQRFMDRSERQSGREPSLQEVEAARAQLLVRAHRLMSKFEAMGVHSEILDEVALTRLISEIENPGSRPPESISPVHAQIRTREIDGADRGRLLPPGPRAGTA